MTSYERLLIPRAWYLGSEADEELRDDSINGVENRILKAEFDRKQNSLLSSPVGSKATVESCLSSHESRLDEHDTAINQRQTKNLSQLINVFGTDTGTVESCLQELAGLDMQEITDEQVDAMWA